MCTVVAASQCIKRNLNAYDTTRTIMSLDELRERAKADFTSEELDDFINMGTKCAAKPVLQLVIEAITAGRVTKAAAAAAAIAAAGTDADAITAAREAGATDDREAEIILKKISQSGMPQDTKGLSVEDVDIGRGKGKPALISVHLTIAPKNYKPQIDVMQGPDMDRVARDLSSRYAMLKGIAGAFWKTWCAKNPTLHIRIQKYRPDLDFSLLALGKDNPETLFFDSNVERRVGIFAFYVVDGQSYYKPNPRGGGPDVDGILKPHTK